jgi:hypothetical protein
MNKIILGNYEEESSSDEDVNIQYIINKKPKTSIVREFLRANICSIRSEDDLLFEPENEK